MKLGIIVGSTREGRQTPKQAKWVLQTAKHMEDVEVELVDLRAYPMPMFDEPVSPRYNPNRKIDPAVKPWLDKLGQFDAYVFVTAEYNHSIPAVLKNALDYVTWEMLRKPAAVISHGSAGGARAQVALKVILSESKAVPIPVPSPLAMSGMSEKINDDGQLLPEYAEGPYSQQAALETMLDDLKWHSDALASARDREAVAV
jgi:NAD(P)H-dependent FMN reductase